MIHFHKWEYYDLWDGKLRAVSKDFAKEMTSFRKHYPNNIGMVFFRNCSKCGKCQQTVLTMGASWTTTLTRSTKEELELHKLSRIEAPHMTDQEIKIGDIFFKLSENPFSDDYYVEVLDLKNGYVQYRYIYPDVGYAASSKTSTSLDDFKSLYTTKSNKTLLEIIA